MSIAYLKGDATSPQTAGPKIIAHIVNDAGGWGKGFVLALSKRWPQPENDYRDWYAQRVKKPFALGEISLVEVGPPAMWVCNMVAQHGLHARNGKPPIRYDALEKCLGALNRAAKTLNASIHMPRIGCGLAGGKWELVEPLIARTLTVPVYVYDF